MGSFLSIGDALAGAIDSAGSAYASESNVSGLATGIKDLDIKLGGLRRSELVVIAARPSMGKTALALNIASNAARAQLRPPENSVANNADLNHGAVVGLFSLETKTKRVAERILSAQACIPSDRIRRGMLSESDFKGLVNASSMTARMPLFVDDTPGITITDVADRSLELKQKMGLLLLVVDYLQLIAGGERQGEGRYQEIAEITAGLKSLAMRLEIPIIAVSQLSRSPESRDDKRPILTDLVGSGSIENDADVVLLLFREEYYLERAKPPEGSYEFQHWLHRMTIANGIAELVVAKNRHGPIGSLRLKFDASIGRFSDVGREQSESTR